jgi:predicted nucleic acid-binding protein
MRLSSSAKSPIGREPDPDDVMRTYVDSGVLITAARGNATLSQPAIDVLSDTTREFVSSEWVRLEVLPKARYFQQQAEIAFYDLFFGRVSIWAPFGPDLLTTAMEEASVAGLSAVDAIHVVLAAISGCEELVTSEKQRSAIHRTTRVRIVSIHPPEDT